MDELGKRETDTNELPLHMSSTLTMNTIAGDNKAAK